jgi:hypothetical protein
MLKKNISVPLPEKYKPEIDVSEMLSEEHATEYQQLIGILRWMCEIGRVDILLETALLSAYNANPRKGHLEAVYHMFAYLKGHVNSTIVFDDLTPDIDHSRFEQNRDWKDFYDGAEDELPPRMPVPRGNGVDTTCFHDSSHANNVVTRRSQTGFIIFVNNAPIVWYSKRQNTVESSTFGSEFVAARAALEAVEALRYKLRMFGIPLNGPTTMFCDNNSVCNNCRTPTSTLNKKHNSICYHRVREAVAADKIRMAKEPTESNLADLFTKILGGHQRRFLLRSITY